jgi:hypothetical protein
MLALSLDVLAASHWDLSKAALRLGCTQSQLHKHIKDHSPAVAALNEARKTLGLHRLS